VVAPSTSTTTFVGLPEPSVGTLTFNATEMFTNSEAKCPISEYTLRSTKNGPLLVSTSIKITGSTLTIDKNVVTTLDFFLQAETSSGVKASQPFNVIIKQNQNNAPYFKPDLPSKFSIELVKGEDGEIKDNSIVKFTSPIAVDDENDEITMSFDTKGKTYIQMNQNSDNSFSMSVNKSGLELKSQSILIQISIKDDH